MTWIRTIGLAALLLAGPAQAQDTAKSADGRYTVSVVPNGEGDENGTGAQALVLYSTKGSTQRRLLISKWNGDYARNLAGLSHPLFSLDGGYVYFSSTDASPNSGYVHQFDLKLNVIKAVCPGWALRVIRTGPYRGYLLVQTHRYWDRPEGGSYNPVFLTHPSGKKLKMIPGSDNDEGELAIDPWLAKMNWRAW
ncbi:hypothetical protein [Sphingomonas sp. Leaf242]|uniref:hypothetical protein n=1 Tax=Sphingomonas sp. Leaf242 TaxID=1736304 RepID=UPI00071572BF|nr:hypothetical protein [Sphingomonas sp. Leaf242]KQO09420.1 hypothetical protein ASF09_07290 [Sphingomonas sp. Leaf242]